MKKIEIKGEIGWDVTVLDVKEQLSNVTGDILVEISSPGGYIIDGVEIFNLISDYSAGKVTTRNVGQAASMASYIMLAGDVVEAYDNTTYMIHNGITWAFGNHHDLRDTADTLESLTMMLAKKYVEKTGKDIEEIKELLDKETYFFGNEMLEHGFVDSILSTEKEKDRAGAIALSSEQFKACKTSTYEHHGDVKHEKMAAVLKGHMKQFENSPKSTQGEKMDYSKLTVKMLQDNCPEMVATMTKASFDKGVEDGKAAGAKAEATRIASIDAEAVAGHEDIIASMKADPTKTATDAILAIYAADKKTKAKAVEDRATDGENLAQKAKDLNTNPNDDDAATKAAAKKQSDDKAITAMISGVKKKG